ncbi:MAG: ABC transporter ATP-binding protein [Myxococcales bacterium]|nr:ABC transporter ATP-binding protein [Myxococcales bacterium]
MRPLVETKKLVRALGGDGVEPQTILHGIDLTIDDGTFVALTGASGSGKSTLLYLLGTLDRQTSGEVWLDGVEVSGLDDDDRARFRNERLGFVFQFHFLLPEFTVLENVMIPMLRRGDKPRDEVEEIAYTTLELLDLGPLWQRKPGQISGGQQQRVSIARAVANDPALILADEPTGNLDSKNGELVFDVFAKLARELNRTVVMVTHDNDFAVRADRQIRLKDGRVVEDVMQR